MTAPSWHAAQEARRGTTLLAAALWGQRVVVGLGALSVGAAILSVAGSATLAHVLTRPRRLRAVTRREIDASVEEITFRTADNLTLRGWFFPCPEPRDAVVICHGFAMNRHELLDIAHELRGRGHAVLLFDFRGHGSSDGRRTTIGFREAGDVRAAVDYLAARPELSGCRIGIAGISMGAAAALLAAPADARNAAVVADSSFATLKGIAADGIRQFSRAPALYVPLVVRFGELLTHARIAANRPIDAISAVAPRPLLLIHGADDRFVPLANALALFGAAREPKELWVVPGCGHAAAWARFPDEYVGRLDRFFADALAGKVTRAA